MFKSPKDHPNPTWGIVCTARETPDVICAFAAHHVAAGASRIYLYLDEPSDRASALLKKIPEVDVTVCDSDHWQRLTGGRRPKGQEHRQVRNAQDAYLRCEVDWLAHIDADEFIAPHRNLAHELACVPSELSYLRLDVRERVYSSQIPPQTLFCGMLRVPFHRRRPAAKAVFGPKLEFLGRGLTGHSVGKSVVRARQDNVLMGIHMPRPVKRERGALAGLECSSANLIHLNGLTPNHWMAKMSRYSHLRPRISDDAPLDNTLRQIKYLQAQPDTHAAILHLFELIRCVTPEDEWRLRGLGLIEDFPQDLAMGLERYDLRKNVDISIKQCDVEYSHWLPQLDEFAA